MRGALVAETERETTMLGFGVGTEPRQALVMGNSTYADAGVLVNAKNDALAMQQALTEVGFKVRLGLDNDRAAIERLFADFANDLVRANAKVGLLYYSGHGVQIDGVNYLVPVTALAEGNELGSLIPLQPMIETMSKQVETRLIFLDACRNNPFVQRLTHDALHAKGINAGKSEKPAKPDAGLAEIKAGADTFIAFAAAPGDVAFEGKGEFSTFTEGLLHHVRATDVPISNLMINVRNYVAAITDGKQITWDQSALSKPFFFNPGSLIMLVGNAIGLTAFLTSLLPVAFALYAREPPNYLGVGATIMLLSLVLFLAGMQRAYGHLRGGLGYASNGQASERYRVPWRRGLIGGYFGGIIATPMASAAYYYAWDPAKIAIRPSFGQLATELSVAGLYVGLMLGLLSLALAEMFALLGPVLLMHKVRLGRLVNQFTGALLGGVLAGILTAPPITLYFAGERPHLDTWMLMTGALPGSAAIAFSVANYRLEQMSLRSLQRSSAAAALATLIGVGVAAIFGWIAAGLIDTHIKQAIGTSTLSGKLWGGLWYGVLAGIILGVVIGLTLVWTSAPERRHLLQRPLAGSFR
jgi:Caspase domain